MHTRICVFRDLNIRSGVEVVSPCATFHCYSNYERKREILLGVITASQASSLLGVDADVDVFMER